MAGIVIYEKIPKKTILSEGKKAIKQISQWFKDNPKRKICRCDFWYGIFRNIRKAHIEEDIQDAVDEALKRGKYGKK